MNINDFVAANSARSYLGLNSGTQSVARTNLAGQAGFDKAEKRIQSLVDVTSAQLSSFGQLKSAVSDTQLAAKALGSLSATSSNAAVKTATESFVGAFNSAISTAKSTSAFAGEGASAQSASRAGKDLVRTVSTDSATRDALKQIGFSLASDGKLTLDVKKFEAAQTADPMAVKATLAKIGQQVDKTATQELASGGNVSNTVSSLSQRASVLKNQQNTLAALQQTATDATSNSNAYSNGFSSFGSFRR
ncbi:MAG: flagellar filament capping protein FliD [Rhodoferax sp.]